MADNDSKQNTLLIGIGVNVVLMLINLFMLFSLKTSEEITDSGGVSQDSVWQQKTKKLSRAVDGLEKQLKRLSQRTITTDNLKEDFVSDIAPSIQLVTNKLINLEAEIKEVKDKLKSSEK